MVFARMKNSIYECILESLLRYPTTFEKFCFCQKYTNGMPTDSVFDGDCESAISFGENIYMKNENRKIRVHFGMYV
ncbi:unnamed protein product [Rotaria magnacalcarata]